MKLIIGQKLGMTQVYNEAGRIVPVTLIETALGKVTAINKVAGEAGVVRIGFVSKLKKARKSKEQRAKKQGEILRERKSKGKEDEQLKVGDIIDLNIFKVGEKVKVTGVSKGKGFQGVVKRWGFKGGPASHGHKHNLRAPGSIGGGYPEKVLKGLKMAGKMGNARITQKGLRIINLDPQKNLLAVKGAVPGKCGALLEVKSDD